MRSHALLINSYKKGVSEEKNSQIFIQYFLEQFSFILLLQKKTINNHF